MKTYVYIEHGDRLGNWMFRLATAGSLSDEVGICVEDESAIGEMRRYPAFAGLEFRVGAVEGARIYREPRFAYDAIPFRPSDGNLLLKGYFQSWRYFDSVKARSMFRMTCETEARLRAEYAEALVCPDITSIGVRRGDYLAYPHRFPFVGKDYYRKAIARMPEVKNFLVCSDDMSWCRGFFSERNFPGRTFHFSHAERDEDDLHLPALCRNNILANSSFSWWGGYLNEHPDKRTLAPSRWFGWDFRRKGYDWSDLYYPGTEIVENESGILRSAGDALFSFWLETLKKRILSPVYQRARRSIFGRKVRPR